MALGDPYATLDDLKSYLGMQEDTRFETSQQTALESVSDEIEQYCNRQFNKATVATAREFPIFYAGYVDVDDFWNTTDLVIESGPPYAGNYGPTDFDLYPLNGVVDGQAGWPYSKIKALPTGSPVRFVPGSRLRITAQWGWAAVPSPIKQACLIMSAATFQSKDAPFGVVGSDQWGSIRVRDNQLAKDKLDRYVSSRILVG
jgi:hypothetical protein